MTENPDRPSYVIRLTPPIEEFAKLRQENVLIDVTFQVGGQKIPAHKIVMAAVGDHFKVLFRGSFKEGTQQIVDLPEVDPVAFEQLVLGIYGQPINITDWRMAVGIHRLMKYFSMRTDLLRVLQMIPVPAKDFASFAQQLLEAVGDEVTSETVDLLATHMQAGADLSDFEDDFILLLLNSPSFQSRDEESKYLLIQQLIEAGRDSSLYNMIQFEKLRPPLVTQISPEIIISYFQSQNRGVRALFLTSNLQDHLPSGRPFIALVMKGNRDEIRLVGRPKGTGSLAYYNVSKTRVFFLYDENETVIPIFMTEETPPLNSIIAVTQYKVVPDSSTVLTIQDWRHL